MAALLGYAADALWIAALAIMAAATRQAWGRIAPDAQIPVALGADGSVQAATTRGPALLAVPVLAFLIGCGLVFLRLWADRNPLAAIGLFAVRASLAALFALAHLRWLRLVLDRLQASGALKS